MSIRFSPPIRTRATTFSCAMTSMTPEQFAAYFDSLADGVNCNYRRDLFPQFGDKVLTLSTCYRQNRTQRFLVQGVLTQEYTVLKK